MRADTVVLLHHAEEKHALVSVLDNTWPVAFALDKIFAKICHMDLPSICWGRPLI